MDNEKNFNFSVTVYGELSSYNNTLSKARCRIFYKGANRNGTFITNEFSDKLLRSLPYTPIKGIYDSEIEDYGDHGEERTEGRIYGIVPENPNIAWEPFLDEDGVERMYACADVLLFTALYEEAQKIVGKSQSMELYSPSIEYHLDYIGGQQYIVFDEGCFLGLQVLGETVEPCFEGASFFALRKSIEDIIQQIHEFSIGETNKMDITEQKPIADSPTQEPTAIDINNDIPAAEPVEPEVEPEAATVVEPEVEPEAVAPVEPEVEPVVEPSVEPEVEPVVEPDARDIQIATLTEENQNLAATNNSLQAEFEKLQAEVQELRTYKYSIEKQQKEAVIANYEGKLSDELLDSYREQLDNYNARDLDKDLTYDLKQTNPEAFVGQGSGIIPKDVSPSGIEEILSRYEK